MKYAPKGAVAKLKTSNRKQLAEHKTDKQTSKARQEHSQARIQAKSKQENKQTSPSKSNILLGWEKTPFFSFSVGNMHCQLKEEAMPHPYNCMFVGLKFRRVILHYMLPPPLFTLFVLHGFPSPSLLPLSSPPLFSPSVVSSPQTHNKEKRHLFFWFFYAMQIYHITTWKGDKCAFKFNARWGSCGGNCSLLGPPTRPTPVGEMVQQRKKKNNALSCTFIS